jgi:Spy/CpxP family protein refolding chaperone
LLFFLAVIAIAGTTAAFTHWWISRSASSAESIGHEWLHNELRLTKAQSEALDPIEHGFAEKEAALRAKLHQANRDLAQVLKEEKSYSPRVAESVVAVHHHMGELQKASLEHLYDMRRILTPEQGDQLFHLAAQSLEQTP